MAIVRLKTLTCNSIYIHFGLCRMEKFFPSVVLNFNDILMRSSNLKVYMRLSNLGIKQNLIIIKCFRETHFEVAKNETIKVANQVFGE